MPRLAFLALPVLLSTAVALPLPAADEVPPNKQYLEFIRKQAAELRKNDKAPATADEWAKQEAESAEEPLRRVGRRGVFPESRLRPRPAAAR